MSRVGVVFVLLLGAACSSGGTGHGVGVATLSLVYDDSVNDSTLATVSALDVRLSGDRSDVVPLALDGAPPRTEIIHYELPAGIESVGVRVEARNQAGGVVAVGSAAPAHVTAGAVSLPVTMMLDTGGKDLGDGGAGEHDMPASQPPSAAGITTSTVDGGTLGVAAPPGTASGTLLIAMTTATAPVGTVVSFTAPAGWTLLSSASAPYSYPSTVTWFYRLATASEPPSYTFPRTTTGSAAVYVTSYTGVDPAHPFEAVSSAVSDGDTTHTTPVHVSRTPSLLVALGVSPDAYNMVWTQASTNTPALNVIQASGLLVTDLALTVAGDLGSASFQHNIGNGRTFGLTAVLRAP